MIRGMLHEQLQAGGQCRERWASALLRRARWYFVFERHYGVSSVVILASWSLMASSASSTRSCNDSTNDISSSSLSSRAWVWDLTQVKSSDGWEQLGPQTRQYLPPQEQISIIEPSAA